MDSKLFDHTILHADATEEEVAKFCDEALKYNFMAVCVNPYYTAFVREKLRGSILNVCTVIGFPLGQMSTVAKITEAMVAIKSGTDEIDMVMNIAALKNKNYDFVREDIRRVVEVSDTVVLKIILETCLLTEEEKRIACQLVVEADADYVKTSTGFSNGGATEADIRLMREIVGKKIGVKASGGIRTREDVLRMVKAGASRIGTSRAVEIFTAGEG